MVMGVGLSRRALVRSAVVAVPAGLIVLLTGLPAQAFPFATVGITSTSTSQTVCADGWGVAGTLWQFTVAGTRDSVSQPLIEAVFPVTTTAIYHQCFVVQKYGADFGNYTATLTGYGVTDLAGVAVADGTWLLGQDEHITTGG
jgi:hypothetical protein